MFTKRIIEDFAVLLLKMLYTIIVFI